jgi:hypothetical protein
MALSNLLRALMRVHSKYGAHVASPEEKNPATILISADTRRPARYIDSRACVFTNPTLEIYAHI